MGLVKELILLRDEVALMGENLSLTESTEVKTVEGVMDDGELIMDERCV